MSEHTQGPWFTKKDGLSYYIDARIGGRMLQEVAYCGPTEKWEEQEANARRIVACVNACEGLSNEQLANICLMDGSLANRFELLLDNASPLGWNRNHD